MSEITEQEAREAAERLRTCAEIAGNPNDKRNSLRDVYGVDDIEQGKILCRGDAVLIAEYFARRDAEQSERALPITAEWLKSIGAKKKDANRWYVLPHVAIHLRDEFVFVVRIGGYMAPLATRGQLLDLLRALKGGE